MSVKKKLFYLLFICFIYFDGQSQTWAWAKSALGQTGANGFGEGVAIATDTVSNNFYITGSFSLPYITLGTFTLFHTVCKL